MELKMTTDLNTKNIAELNEQEIAEVQAEYEARLKAIENRKNELADQALVEIQKIMQQKGVATKRMIDFLEKFAKSEGVLVKYNYINKNGEAKVFLYRQNQKGINPFLKDIKAKKISKEQALSYASGADGAKYVTALFK
jgi:DNA-binding protein H-NS